MSSASESTSSATPRIGDRIPGSARIIDEAEIRNLRTATDDVHQMLRQIDASTRAAVLNCLIEGCSIRSTVRMTGVSKKAVSRLLVEAGNVAAEYQDRVMRNLPCKRIQVDELWTFNYCKEKNVTEKIREKVPGAGSIWLWVAMDADTKLVPCVAIGSRNTADAYSFISDLASRLRYRVQMTTDGHRPYLEAVEAAFGADIDYAMLVKLYGNTDDPKSAACRTASAARSRTTWPPWRSTTSPTTSSRFTGR
jgi:hypothetical protein